MTGLQILFPPPCRDEGTRYVVTGLQFWFVPLLLLLLLVTKIGGCSSGEGRAVSREAPRPTR